MNSPQGVIARSPVGATKQSSVGAIQPGLLRFVRNGEFSGNCFSLRGRVPPPRAQPEPGLSDQRVENKRPRARLRRRRQGLRRHHRRRRLLSRPDRRQRIHIGSRRGRDVRGRRGHRKLGARRRIERPFTAAGGERQRQDQRYNQRACKTKTMSRQVLFPRPHGRPSAATLPDHHHAARFCRERVAKPLPAPFTRCGPAFSPKNSCVPSA